MFHTVFGKTVPDISLNAIANLGYAECRFLRAVYPGDTLSAASEVIGLRENSNRASGVVYVRTTGRNQRGEIGARVRALGDGEEARSGIGRAGARGAEARRARRSGEPRPGRAGARRRRATTCALAGAPHRWGDYAAGEKIDHADAMTLEEAEHQIATRLYQNTAKVHFNLHEQAQGQFKRRLVYGGVVISLARALSFNGLANAFHIAAINGGRHVAPCFAGDTVYAWSEVLETAEIPGRARHRRPAHAAGRRQEPQLRRFPAAQRQRRLRRRRDPRSRPVAGAAALIATKRRSRRLVYNTPVQLASLFSAVGTFRAIVAVCCSALKAGRPPIATAAQGASMAEARQTVERPLSPHLSIYARRSTW